MRLARSALPILVLALAGCPRAGAGTVTGPDPVALANADARLHGAWKLVRFQPERPLDAMSQAFVTFQYNNLTVRFDRGRFVAESPGVHVDRAYRIIEADGDRFKVVSYDEQGVPYDAVGTFVQADTLEINSWTEPWRGVATLTRTSPWENVPGPLPNGR
ncbi:MAG: hypothetical protein QM820_02510 [Minicystis sp.]